MFTGIVTDIGEVIEMREAGDRHLRIGTCYDVASIPTGASIACSGICLTVVETGSGNGSWFAVTASAETLARSTAGSWKVGRRINLERPLKVGDELGGHIVTGHVDGVGRLVSAKPEGESLRLLFDAPQPLMRYIAEKGSVAVDGVSLTVNEAGKDRFGVNIIPFTQRMTTLGVLKPGDGVNLEIDVLARYVARMEEMR
ncbi:MAG: riboflavin synthase [Alphaproteobacteria bacterium]|nr:riboflavin synthase [Alphaproteobacteria bacterium]